MMTAQAYSTGRQKIMHTAQEKRRFLYDVLLLYIQSTNGPALTNHSTH